MAPSITDAQFQRLRRHATAAEMLRADETFKEIIVDLKARAIREWSETAPSQQADREIFWHDLRAIGRLEKYLAELGQSYRLEAQKHKVVTDGR